MIRVMRNIHWTIMALFQAVSGLGFTIILYLIYRYAYVQAPIYYNLSIDDYKLLGCMGMTSYFS